MLRQTIFFNSQFWGVWTKFKQLHLKVFSPSPSFHVSEKKTSLHSAFIPLCSFKVEKSCFIFKIMRSLFFLRKKFESMKMQGDSQDGSLWKNFFHLSADDDVLLLFCVKLYNCCYGMSCNWIKNVHSVSVRVKEDEFITVLIIFTSFWFLLKDSPMVISTNTLKTVRITFLSFNFKLLFSVNLQYLIILPNDLTSRF